MESKIYMVCLHESPILRSNKEHVWHNDPFEAESTLDMGFLAEACFIEQFLSTNPKDFSKRIGLEFNDHEWSIEFLAVDDNHAKLISDGKYSLAAKYQSRFDFKVLERRPGQEDVIREGDCKLVKRSTYNSIDCGSIHMLWELERKNIFTANQLRYIQSMGVGSSIYLTLMQAVILKGKNLVEYSFKVIKVYKYMDPMIAGDIRDNEILFEHHWSSSSEERAKRKRESIGHSSVPRRLHGTGRFSGSQAADGTGNGNNLTVTSGMRSNGKPKPKSQPSYSGPIPKSGPSPNKGKKPISGGTSDAGSTKP